MRLGAPVWGTKTPEEWVSAHKKAGYGAAYWPLGYDAADSDIEIFARAARDNNIIIAETGAWSNTISKDDKTRKAALDLNVKQLILADRVGAKCCVNITGSRGEKWDGHHADNYTKAIFDLIVDSIREIIDRANPKNAYYTLELMPWALPDSADTYLDLIRAVDRKMFAVHLDPVNIIKCPRDYYFNGDLIKDMFTKLGPYIKSCHGKDVIMHENLTLHIDEAGPGMGNLDYAVYLKCISELEEDVPLMLEHLNTAEDYAASAEYVKKVASENGLVFNV